MILFPSADFFHDNFFSKILCGILSERLTVWIQIRTDILLVLIWVQTVFKANQQMTKVCASMERVIMLYYRVALGSYMKYCTWRCSNLLQEQGTLEMNFVLRIFIEG